MRRALRIGALMALVLVAVGAPFTGLAIAGLFLLADRIEARR